MERFQWKESIMSKKPFSLFMWNHKRKKCLCGIFYAVQSSFLFFFYLICFFTPSLVKTATITAKQQTATCLNKKTTATCKKWRKRRMIILMACCMAKGKKNASRESILNGGGNQDRVSSRNTSAYLHTAPRLPPPPPQPIYSHTYIFFFCRGFVDMLQVVRNFLFIDMQTA